MQVGRDLRQICIAADFSDFFSACLPRTASVDSTNRATFRRRCRRPAGARVPDGDCWPPRCAELAQWAERFELSESELQILWCLCGVIGPGVDQTTLAAQLAFSPPQVSACVEKLRARGLIVHHEATGDRRRRLWQSSAERNRDLLQEIVQAAGESREAAA